MRRVTGQSVSRFVANEITGPLGADFFIGLPDHEDARAAEMIEGPNASAWLAQVQGTPFPHSCINPVPRALWPNDRAWRAAEVPGANGHATANALARIYGMMAEGGTWEGKRLVERATIVEAARARFRGIDESFDGQPDIYLEGGDHRSLVHMSGESFRSIMKDVRRGSIAA